LKIARPMIFSFVYVREPKFQILKFSQSIFQESLQIARPMMFYCVHVWGGYLKIWNQPEHICNVYICIYVRTSARIRCMDTHTHTHTYTDTLSLTQAPTRTDSHTQAYRHTGIQTHTLRNTSETHTHAYTQTQTRTHTHTYTLSLLTFGKKPQMWESSEALRLSPKTSTFPGGTTTGPNL